MQPATCAATASGLLAAVSSLMTTKKEKAKKEKAKKEKAKKEKKEKEKEKGWKVWITPGERGEG